MTQESRPLDPQSVFCEVCLKRVPEAEALRMLPDDTASRVSEISPPPEDFNGYIDMEAPQ